MTDRRVRARLMLAATLALLACVAAVAWYRSRTDTVAVTGSVGFCSAGLQAGHPGGCNALRAVPSILLLGPGGAEGRHSHVFVVQGEHDRTFRVSVPRGAYSVFVVADGSLIGARSHLAHLMQLDRAHNRLGTVTPADSWKWSGRIHVAPHGGKL